MTSGPINRLDSLWPSHSAGRDDSALTDPQQLAARIQPWIDRVETTIGEHPRTTLTAAATLGAILGWFIKRK